MKTRDIVTLALTAVIGMTSAVGCGAAQQKSPQANPCPGYRQPVCQVAIDEEAVEGKIVDVQPGELEYEIGIADYKTSPSHEFIYVTMLDNSGKYRTLIYPHTRAIREGEARLVFNPLREGRIDSADFVTEFVKTLPGYSDYNSSSAPKANYHLLIKAEGVITENGIHYLR